MGSLSETYGAGTARPALRDRPLVDAGLHWILMSLVSLGILFWAAAVLAVVAVLG